MDKGSILFVDDDRSILDMYGVAFKKLGYEVFTSENADDALARFNEGHEPPSIVVSDIVLPSLNGIDFLKRVKHKCPGSAVIVMTGQGTLEFAIEALRAGASEFVCKPVQVNDLARIVARLRDQQTKQRGLEGAADMAVSCETVYKFTPRHDYLYGLAAYLANMITLHKFYPREHVTLLEVAIHELVVNSVEHGCLELDSGLKGANRYDGERAKRLGDPRYCGRIVTVQLVFTSRELALTITDEGQGFDWRQALYGTDLGTDMEYGRGIPIAKKIFDKVRWNEKGNSIRVELSSDAK